MDNEILYRPPQSSDWPLIAKSWKLAWRKTLYPLSNRRAGEAVEATIKDLLSSGATIAIAASPRFPDEIYGFSCYDENCVYFLYVKEAYRDLELRIGQSLLALAGTTKFKYTTPYVRWLLKSTNETEST